MLALGLTGTQARSSQRLAWLFLAILAASTCPSYGYALPAYAVHPHPRSDTPAAEPRVKNGADFTRDFAAAIGVAVAVVMIGTALICAFAHCWRQILDWSWADRTAAARTSRHRNEEDVWFCGANRGLPMPQFDILEPEAEPLTMAMRVPDPEVYTAPYYSRDSNPSPAAYVRNVVPGSRARSKAHWNDSTTTLPSWLDADEIERPASVAYLLDRP